MVLGTGFNNETMETAVLYTLVREGVCVCVCVCVCEREREREREEVNICSHLTKKGLTHKGKRLIKIRVCCR